MGGKRKSVKHPRELSEKELFEMLSPKREIDLKIKKTFEESDLPERFSIILVESLADYVLINPRLVKYFLERKIRGVYVTVNKGLAALIETLESEGIQTDSVEFIDVITRMAGNPEVNGKNFHYIDSPKDLVALSVTLEKVIRKLGGGKKFIVIDSLTTLLVYNREGVVEKFVHSLSGKIKSWNAQGVFILMDSTREEVANTLAQFCDKVARL